LSANDPPVNEPTVAPARSVLTIQPVQGFFTHDNQEKMIDGAYANQVRTSKMLTVTEWDLYAGTFNKIFIQTSFRRAYYKVV